MTNIVELKLTLDDLVFDHKDIIEAYISWRKGEVSKSNHHTT